MGLYFGVTTEGVSKMEKESLPQTVKYSLYWDKIVPKNDCICDSCCRTYAEWMRSIHYPHLAQPTFHFFCEKCIEKYLK